MQTQSAKAITLISSRGHYWKHPAENITSGLRNKWGWFGRWLLVTCTTYFYPLITTTFGPCFQAIKTHFTECYLSKKNKIKWKQETRSEVLLIPSLSQSDWCSEEALTLLSMPVLKLMHGKDGLRYVMAMASRKMAQESIMSLSSPLSSPCSLLASLQLNKTTFAYGKIIKTNKPLGLHPLSHRRERQRWGGPKNEKCPSLKGVIALLSSSSINPVNSALHQLFLLSFTASAPSWSMNAQMIWVLMNKFNEWNYRPTLLYSLGQMWVIH